MFDEERYIEFLKIEDQKTKGTYYTPREIVIYMCKECLINNLVNNSKLNYEAAQRLIYLGELLEDYDIQLIDKCLADIKVADISVGAGAFIIGMLNEIVNARASITSYLLANVNKKQSKEIMVHRSKANLKLHAIKNSLFAADIEHKAVELTKERLLAILGNGGLSTNTKEELKIVHNNSLNNKFVDTYPFNQKFDIVIGNPPYVDSEEMCRNLEDLRATCLRQFKSARGNWDLFVVFVEQGLNILKENGTITYIVPNKLLSAKYTEQLRKIMLQYSILELRDLSNVPVFKNANVYPIIFVADKTFNKEKVKVTTMETSSNIKNQTYIDPEMFYQDIHWSRYFSIDQDAIKIMQRLASLPKLNEHAYIYGAAAVSEAYKVKDYLQEYTSDMNSYKKMINTGTIDPYQSWWGIKRTKYIKKSYAKPVITEKSLKNISYKRYLQANSVKIIVSGMTKQLECYYDDGECIAGKSTVIILEKDVELKYLLAVLNSKLINFYYVNFFKSLSLSSGYLRVGPPQIKQIPIINPNKDIKEHIINLVDNILERTIAADYTISQEKQLEVEKYKKAIDKYIYKIYNLQPEEIKLVAPEI
ncbi:MAG: hypothetical protein FH758_15770 [Firmicutes bacterium]|nr:hypothetical protein [Bacillota bacterium]